MSKLYPVTLRGREGGREGEEQEKGWEVKLRVPLHSFLGFPSSKGGLEFEREMGGKKEGRERGKAQKSTC